MNLVIYSHSNKQIESYLSGAGRDGKNGTFRKKRNVLCKQDDFFMAFRNFRPFPPIHMKMAANVIFMLIIKMCMTKINNQ